MAPVPQCAFADSLLTRSLGYDPTESFESILVSQRYVAPSTFHEDQRATNLTVVSLRAPGATRGPAVTGPRD
jgi:hypothetical protein